VWKSNPFSSGYARRLPSAITFGSDPGSDRSRNSAERPLFDPDISLEADEYGADTEYEEDDDEYGVYATSSGSGRRGGFLPPPDANGTRLWPGPILLPPVNITNGREQVEIYNAECFNITMGPVGLSFSAPLVIAAELTGVGIGCYTDVAVRLGKRVLRRFYVELELGGSSLELMMALRQRPSTGFNATLESCHCVLIVTELESSLKAINESAVIENYFETQLNVSLCQEFRTLIDVNLTQELRRGAVAVEHYIDDASTDQMWEPEVTLICGVLFLAGIVLLLGIAAVWETLKRRNTPDFAGYARVPGAEANTGARSRRSDLYSAEDGEADFFPRHSTADRVVSAQPVDERAPLLGGGGDGRARRVTGDLSDPERTASWKYDPYSSTDTSTVSEEPPPVYEEKLLLRRLDAPLLLHFRLPAWVRYGLPFMLVFNLFLFLTANLAVGASVYVVLSNPNGAVVLPSLSDFKLTNSVKEMWDARAYGLSVLIAIFSGIWPYVKLVLMLFSWVAPSKLLAPERRGRILRVVDALGKWSLIDSYVLIMMMVSFRVTLGHPYGTTDVALDVYVQGQVGFFIFLAATMLSLLLSHVSVASHRHAVEPPFPDSKLAPRESLSAHEFGMGKDRDTLLSCTILGRTTIASVLLLALGLLTAGTVIDSFSFVIEGLLGTAMQWTKQDVVRDYSVIALAIDIPDASFYDQNGLGVRTLQVVFVMFTLIFPLLHLLSLVLLWLFPLPLRGQYYLFVTMEIVNAWSALDVFVVSIIVSVLELTTFAESVVGNCGGLTEFMHNNFPYSGYQTCFGVSTQLLSGCWMLFCAVMIYTVCTILCMNLCTKALRERIFRTAHFATIQSQSSLGHREGASRSTDWNSSHSDDDLDSLDRTVGQFTTSEEFGAQGQHSALVPTPPQSSSSLSRKLSRTNLWLAERALVPLRLIRLQYPPPSPSVP